MALHNNDKKSKRKVEIDKFFLFGGFLKFS